MKELVITRLTELETVIEHGLQTFVDVGTALMEIRDSRLYRDSHGTFEDYCRERWGLKRQRAYELIDAARIAGSLSEISDKAPVRESHVAPLASLPADTQREVWQRAVETAPNGKVTAKHVEQTVVEYKQTAVAVAVPVRPHVANNSGNNEWYTPMPYAEAARRVLGGIDLDPASSDEANQVVKATRYYTVDDDGLAQAWQGNVYMNPPYSTDLIGKFGDKLLDHLFRGDVPSAIVLVNNATDTAWFHSMATWANALCFPRGRIRFWSPGGEIGAPLQGQAILYFGQDRAKFAAEFAEFGIVATL